MENIPSVLISAGEPSGDRAAARVVQALFRAGVRRFYGIGGDAMRQAGVELVAHIGSLTALGIAAGAARLLGWAYAWADLRDRARTFRPNAALLVDAPEINLPLARALKEQGIPVIFYIGPQVWAWRKNRLRLLKDRTDAVALILPFEKPIYDKAGVHAVFVGHPILDEPPAAKRAAVRRSLRVSGEEPLVAMLPGSRPAELSRHLSIMKETALCLYQHNIRAVLAPGGPRVIRNTAMDDGPMFLPEPFCARDLLSASDAALVASGTATLEAAVAGVPTAAVYRIDPISYVIGRYGLSLPYIALPNWILQEKVIPEIIQNSVNTENLCIAVSRLLDPAVAAAQRKAFRKVAASLGGPGAAEKVASLVLERLS